MVFDEIQTGCGRTGFWFAFEKYGIVPDILLLAKGLGAGLPLGAVISSKENLWTFTENPVLGHITTFGGNPVCCAASLAMFETIDQESLISTILKKEALFSKLLKHPKINAFNHAGLLMAIHFETAEFNQKVIQRCIEKILQQHILHSAIKNIRTAGLWASLEFDSFEMNKKVIERCIEYGLITDWFLFAPNALRIAPPLIINDKEIILICDIILESINEIDSFV